MTPDVRKGHSGAALATAPTVPEHDRTPAGEVRRAPADGIFALPNDPGKIVRAMVDLVARDDHVTAE